MHFSYGSSPPLNAFRCAAAPSWRGCWNRRGFRSVTAIRRMDGILISHLDRAVSLTDRLAGGWEIGRYSSGHIFGVMVVEIVAIKRYKSVRFAYHMVWI